MALFETADTSGTEALLAMFVEPMLGKALKEGDSIDNYVNDPDLSIEIKYDGHRVIIYVDDKQIVRAWSRDRNVRELARHIVRACSYLAPGVYDGELFIPGRTSTDVTRKDLFHQHKLVLFDILSIYAPQDVGRVDALGYRSTLQLMLSTRRSLLSLAMSKVPVADVFQAPVMNVTSEVLATAWANGEEGVMLKDNRGVYEPGKRKWLKFKKELIGRMKVTGYKAGKMGPHSVICGVDEHGVQVQCKTLDTIMRNTFDANPSWAIGRTLVFNYQQKTNDGRYRHPRADHFED